MSDDRRTDDIYAEKYLIEAEAIQRFFNCYGHFPYPQEWVIIQSLIKEVKDDFDRKRKPEKRHMGEDKAPV